MATVVCEKHHLRYDPEMHSGCAVCRREAEGGSAGAAPVVLRADEKKGGLLLPLGVAASIWFLAASVLYVTHQSLASAYLFDRAEREAAARAAARTAAETAVPVTEAPPPIDPYDAQPGSLDDQTDQAVQELRAQRGNEPAPTGTGAPALIPSSEQLSQPPSPIDANEEPTSNEPVVIDTGSGGVSSDGQEAPPPPPLQP